MKKEIRINTSNNEKVTLVTKIVLAGILASSFAVAGTTEVVHADTVSPSVSTSSASTSQKAPSIDVSKATSDYNYQYVGIPSWQEVDQEENRANEFNAALAAENANLAALKAGKSASEHVAITTPEPTTPTPEKGNYNVLQPGDVVVSTGGWDYIKAADGKLYRQADSLPTWGLLDSAKDEIAQDEAAIAKDKAAEAKYQHLAATPAKASKPSISPIHHATSPVHSASSLKTYPQTGNKMNLGITILGVILAGIASGATYVKVTGKKIFGKLF